MTAITSQSVIPRAKIRKALVTLLGSERVLHTPEELLVYECDGLTLHSHLPDFVVFPSSTQEVLQIVRLARRHRIPFLARGAGTSLSGGTIAAEGGIVLELSRMNRILEIDLENRLAQVEPGVVNQHVTQAVEADGFYYAPDPSSQVASTIGGNVAEKRRWTPHAQVRCDHQPCAGAASGVPGRGSLSLGNRCWRSGRFRPGRDLRRFRGNLGIATEVTVRLLHSAPAVKTLLAVYDSTSEATQTVSGIIARGIVPAALEMIDKNTIQAIEAGSLRQRHSPGCRGRTAYRSGRPGSGHRPTTGGNPGGHSIRPGPGGEGRSLVLGAKKLWAARKNAFGAYGRISPNYYTMDGVIPRSKLPEVLDRIESLGREYGLRMANVFHAGDGNLHPSFSTTSPRSMPGRRSWGWPEPFCGVASRWEEP